MNIKRILTALAGLGLVLSLSACGGASDEEKEIVLQEVAARGFADVTLAPDMNMNRTVFVYATYGGCRLRLSVLDGRISYGDLNDLNVVTLDQLPDFQPCRDAAIGAQPSQ